MNKVWKVHPYETDGKWEVRVGGPVFEDDDIFQVGPSTNVGGVLSDSYGEAVKVGVDYAVKNMGAVLELIRVVKNT